MINLYELNHEQLVDFLSSLGEKRFRAQQVWDWMYMRRVASIDDMVNLPKTLIIKLSENSSLGSLKLATGQHSRDGTEKRLYGLRDGQLIEAVLMRYQDGRQTACISTQAGCALGCVFCATGQMGFGRHLTSAEIFEQAMIFARELASQGERLSNVVLMGMGEPFHNYDASLEAIRQLMSRLGIGARHITVSTVGLVPQIRRFADEGLQAKLAVSLHKSDDAERSALMPINRRWNIASVIDACRYYTEKTGRRVTFEWAAIAGENDTPEEAQRLGRLLQGLLCHVNIIPLNPTGGYSAAPSDSARINQFIETLSSYSISSTVRVRRGIDIDAGCGQLKTRAISVDQIG